MKNSKYYDIAYKGEKKMNKWRWKYEIYQKTNKAQSFWQADPTKMEAESQLPPSCFVIRNVTYRPAELCHCIKNSYRNAPPK